MKYQYSDKVSEIWQEVKAVRATGNKPKARQMERCRRLIMAIERLQQEYAAMHADRENVAETMNS